MRSNDGTTICEIKAPATWGFIVRVFELNGSFYTENMPTRLGMMTYPATKHSGLREALSKACDIAGVD